MYNSFKHFLRSLKRNKTMSVITIGGYAISMAVFLILLTFIIGERSINRGFENGENIYRITRSGDESSVPMTLYDDVKEKIPGIDKMCLYIIRPNLYKIGNHQENANFIATNDDFLEMFSFEFIYKSFEPTLFLKENIVLTKTFSEKLFGERNPVGEFLVIGDESYNIVGVVNDVPKNSSFRFDAFMNLEQGFISKLAYSNEEVHVMMNSFVMLNPNSDIETVNSQLEGMISHWKLFEGKTLSLQPLSKVYFNGLRSDQLQHANVNLIYLLSSIAIIILLMTVFNYVNLTISRGYERLNEIGVKKTAGAAKKDIFRQVLAESVFISLLAMILAFVSFSVISPLFTDVLGKRIELNTLFSYPLILILSVLIFFATGILSGIYPALIFSGVSPLQMMVQSKSFKQKGQRAGIIAVQFMITSILIISLLFIQKQLDYVKFKDPGFDKEMLVRVDLRGNAIQKSEVLKNELLNYPQIIAASLTSGSPLHVIGTSSGYYDVKGEKKLISEGGFGIDEDFVETFGLTLVKGRNIRDTDSSVCLINEHLFHDFEWEEIEGKKVGGNRVVGVVKDFHFKNLYNEIGNLKLQKIPKQYAYVINVKIDGNIMDNIEIIKNEYKKVEPEIPFTFKFYDDWLQSMYQKEEKQAGAIKVFALLAIIISCLGLIGLIEHITNKKVKEIGIRKINGAKIIEVITLLNKNVVKWVVVGFIVACPVAYYAMNKWLENFAYKTTLSWWIFALAGIIALGIALLTVSWQSWRAATRNPVEALRYE